MAEDSPAIVTTLDDNIAIIRFNRPASRNPLSSSTLHDLETRFSELAALQEIKSIIFTGTEDVFAAGADIRELAELDSTSAHQFSKNGQGVFQRIADARQLTIAAISGYCMGGALDLALACDIRVASKNAIFAHPGARLGIITGWCGTQRLPRIIKRGVALELLLTGNRISSDEALRVGLVTNVSDTLLDTALSIARRSTDQ
jgi:enoyl-CoA hydratase/carnithine racemase